MSLHNQQDVETAGVYVGPLADVSPLRNTSMS